jgi:hypothetical protein
MATLKPLLPSDQQWIDPRTGRPTQIFFDYLRVLDLTLRGAWTAYTPSLAAGTGTFTSASVSAAWIAIGKTVLYRGTVSITTAGTAAGDLIVGLPSTTKAPAVGSALDSVGSGSGLIVYAAASAATAFIRKDDTTTIIADGRTVDFMLPYEQA